MAKKTEFERLIFHCPFCNAKTQFKFIWFPSQAVLQQIHGYITRYLLQCTACEDYLFVHTQRIQESHPSEPNVVAQFPPVGIEPHAAIPPSIASDYREASLCLSAGAWNACVTMCRRAIQSCAKDQNANPKNDLFKQLKELNEKGIIPDSLYKVADAIRKKGNVGAHPGKEQNEAEVVEKPEAQAVFHLTEQTFRYIYELPHDAKLI